jgi:hypothetical protein
VSLTKIYGAATAVPTGTTWTKITDVAPSRVLTAVAQINALPVGATFEARWIGTVDTAGAGNEVVLWAGTTTVAAGGAGLVTPPLPVPSITGRLEVRHGDAATKTVFIEIFKVGA